MSAVDVDDDVLDGTCNGFCSLMFAFYCLFYFGSQSAMKTIKHISYKSVLRPDTNKMARGETKNKLELLVKNRFAPNNLRLWPPITECAAPNPIWTENMILS